MSAHHTSGPWHVGPTDDTAVRAADGTAICYMCGDYDDDQEWPVMEANARLIAAVPDLLEALQLVCDTYGFDPSIDSSIWQTAFAAIEKAKS